MAAILFGDHKTQYPIFRMRIKVKDSLAWLGLAWLGLKICLIVGIHYFEVSDIHKVALDPINLVRINIHF